MGMLILTWALAYCIAANDEPEPVAMVLGVQGDVKLRRMDLLREGDEVRLPASGGLRLVFLADGHKEAVRSGATVRITGSGATPAQAVLREASRIPTRQLEGLRGLAASARSGVSRVRDIGAPPLPVSPIDGSVISTDRPAFAWRPARDVRQYEVEVFRGEADRERGPLWSARAAGARLDYPGRQPALVRGETYTWHVIASRDEIVAKGRFAVASEEEAREFESIKRLARSTDASDRLLAAMILETGQVYDESNRLFEGLAKELPGEPWVLLGFARHLARVGRVEEALSQEKEALALAGRSR
jgi:hypothetical protein